MVFKFHDAPNALSEWKTETTGFITWTLTVELCRCSTRRLWFTMVLLKRASQPRKWFNLHDHRRCSKTSPFFHIVQKIASSFPLRLSCSSDRCFISLQRESLKLFLLMQRETAFSDADSCSSPRGHADISTTELLVFIQCSLKPWRS